MKVQLLLAAALFSLTAAGYAGAAEKTAQPERG